MKLRLLLTILLLLSMAEARKHETKLYMSITGITHIELGKCEVISNSLAHCKDVMVHYSAVTPNKDEAEQPGQLHTNQIEVK